jgi:hypothetical protein
MNVSIGDGGASLHGSTNKTYYTCRRRDPRIQCILAGTVPRTLILGVTEDGTSRRGGADPAAARRGGSAETAAKHCWSAARRHKDVDGLDQARMAVQRGPNATLAVSTSEGPNSLPRRFTAVFASLMPHRILRVTISHIIRKRRGSFCFAHLAYGNHSSRVYCMEHYLSVPPEGRNDDGTLASGGNSPILVNETWTARIYAEDDKDRVPP